MRKSVLSFWIIAVALLLGATTVLFVKYRQSTVAYTDMKAAEETARTRYTQTIDAIAEIQDSLNAISPGDENVRLLSSELSTEQRMTEASGRQALDRIAVLRSSILRNKERIQTLESNLKQNGIKVAGLQRMITNLKHTVTEKEEFIAQLTGRVDSLQTQVASLETTVQDNQETIQAREQTIEEKRHELATVYYVIGTKKTLTASGLVAAKGGLLGLGKTLQPTGRADESLFTAIDTDEETVIRTASPRARVLSAQPPSSYELQLVEGQMELHILNPTEFRKVKQLVILT
jgi:uncharacterized protein HemX